MASDNRGPARTDRGPTTTDQYSAFATDDRVVIHDLAEPTAWVSSTAAVDLSEAR